MYYTFAMPHLTSIQSMYMYISDWRECSLLSLILVVIIIPLFYSLILMYWLVKEIQTVTQYQLLIHGTLALIAICWTRVSQESVSILHSTGMEESLARKIYRIVGNFGGT